MAIRFRCQSCSGLMSIASRKAGALVPCATCGEMTLVPMQDIFEAAVAPVALNNENSTIDLPPAAPARPPANEEFFQPYPSDASFERQSESDDDETEVTEAVASADAEGDDADEDAPALQLSRRSRIDDEMDLTPMVDVTFQLLIFFMVTASFALQKSIEVPTPDQDKKGAAQQLQLLEDVESTSIKVQIDASNSILMDDEAVGDASRLSDLLKDKMRKEQKTELLISAHPLALHRTVIEVIDAANNAGVQKIRMVSRQGKSD